MVLVFSFLTLSVVLTSCSSDDSEVTQTNPDELLDDVFKATGSGTNIENFATTGSNFKIIDANGYNVTLDLVNLSIDKLRFVDEEWIPDNTYDTNTKFDKTTKVVSVNSETEVGKYRITYSFTDSTREEVTDFTVYYDENKTVDGVTATIYQFRNDYLNDSNDPNEHQTFDGIKVPITPNTKTLNRVPYQFLVGSRLYQLSLESSSETQYDFSNTDNYGQWAICELSPPTDFNSEYTLPSDVITNITVRTKKYDQDQNNPINPTIMFYELKLDSDVLNYSDFTNNTLNPSSVVTFSTDPI